MKKTAVLCQSPLQLINAIEYIGGNSNLSLENTLFFIDLKSGRSDSWEREFERLKFEFNVIHEHFKFTSITISSCRATKNNDFKVLLERLTAYEVIIFGELKSVLFKTLSNCLNSQRRVFVDDGAASLRFNNKFNFFTTMLLKMKGYSCKLDFLNLKIFTVYELNLPNEILKKNHYKFLSAFYLTKGQPVFRGCCLIGQPLEELGIVSFKSSIWVRIKTQIEENFGYKSEVYYIPHRRDSERKLNYLESEGIHVLKLSYPFELFLIEKNIKAVAGFYSSALFSSTLLPPSEKDVFVFNMLDFVIGLDNKNSISKVLNSLKDIKGVRFVG